MISTSSSKDLLLSQTRIRFPAFGDAKVKIKVTYPVAQPVPSVEEARAAPNEPTFIESWKELVARTR